MRIEHLNLSVSDLEASLAFYGELLGWGVRWRGQAQGAAGPVEAAHLGDEACYLALFQAEAAADEGPDSRYSQPGVNHVGFVVDDLDQTLARLSKLGPKVHFQPEYDPGRRAYFFDADGIEVELIEY